MNKQNPNPKPFIEEIKAIANGAGDDQVDALRYMWDQFELKYPWYRRLYLWIKYFFSGWKWRLRRWKRFIVNLFWGKYRNATIEIHDFESKEGDSFFDPMSGRTLIVKSASKKRFGRQRLILKYKK